MSFGRISVVVLCAAAVTVVLAGTPAAFAGELGVPGVPAIDAVTAGDATALVSWTPPASDGGGLVESYVVTAIPGGSVVTAPGDVLSATVTGLPNGVATTFTVVAVNAAGPGGASAESEPVTPRQLARLVVAKQPAPLVSYGMTTTVGAALLTAADIGIAGEQVDLMSRVRPSTTWERVASGTTGADGTVTLRTALPANAALRLTHPSGVVSAPDVAAGSVAVSTRVTASASATRIRLGTTVVVRGSVAPARPAGSLVQIQRYVSGAWRAVASGRMTTTTAYGVSWKPTAAGAYALRVVKPGDASHATGGSGQWRQQVDPENASDIARAILGNRRITLETTHESGVRDLATARQNIADVAAGRSARRSSYGNGPGGYTRLDLRLLRALRQLGALGSVTVSEIAGGSHSGGSMHYAGRGLDINVVNGRHVGRGSGYAIVIEACRANGASRIYSPSYDPYGGHGNHVHCEWS